MAVDTRYDVAIVGGGLAGLAAGILLSRQGYSVAIFEKEKYPFHKVCGEYISMESWDFLISLGVPLCSLQLPLINTLFLSSTNGKSFITRLPQGGFGISRYRLDSMLAEIAMGSGVQLFEQVKVQDVVYKDHFQLDLVFGNGEKKSATANVCLAAYGKRSSLDLKWARSFLALTDKRLDNYVGVKYHIKTDWQENMIGLHNFSGGYCGISKIEEDRFCLCYMTRADVLKASNGKLKEFEKDVLFRNPHLKKILSESEICQEFPVTISQISFQQKSQVENGVLMLGDAAGMITPLCGNGMSIALHTAKLAALAVQHFLEHKIDRQQMEQQYAREWKSHFEKRLKTGRMLQVFFGKERWSNLFVSVFKFFPGLAEPVVKMTHGKPF